MTNFYEINRKASKSGKRAVFFPTVNGVRISSTNFSAKWEAKKLLRNTIASFGDAKLADLTA